MSSIPLRPRPTKLRTKVRQWASCSLNETETASTILFAFFVETNCLQHGSIAHLAVLSYLLVMSMKPKVLAPSKRPLAPGLKLLVQQGRGLTGLVKHQLRLVNGTSI
jgi:hypothetical protein